MIPISKPSIGPLERQAVIDVLESGHLVQGPRVAALEESFARLCGVRHAVATSSGTTALHLALLAHDIGPGDEVITTPFTFIASVNSILQAGATPVFADVDPQTFTLDPQCVRDAVTPRTRAIMAVHLYGQTCDMRGILDIAAEHGLVVLEDAAQAAGATYEGRPSGSMGTGAFSLYATKNLAAGEGGMVTTDDDLVAERVRLLRNHGMRRRYHHEFLGFNARMTDLHAAIGLVQIGRLDGFNTRRAENAARLSAALQTVVVPVARPGSRHVWHQFTVQTPEGMDRDDAVARLADRGVGTGIFYPLAAHEQPHLAQYAKQGQLPIAERLARTVFSLPVHPELTDADLTIISREVNSL